MRVFFLAECHTALNKFLFSEGENVELQMSERSSKKNTFGWVRAEVLGALINGVFLLALCFSIAIESLTRLVEPEKIKEPRHVLVVGSIGLLINLIGMFMFHSTSLSSPIFKRHYNTVPTVVIRTVHMTRTAIKY